VWLVQCFFARHDFLLPSDSGGQMIKCTKAEVRRPKTALRRKIPLAQRERIQIVLWRESGMTQPAIAQGMGVSLSTVNRAHMAYDTVASRHSSPSRTVDASART
jgi:DNA-binding CsgD family transcriptional regulator